MKRSTNNQEVKMINRNRVFRYINSTEKTCMPEISAELDISGPTVLTIVNELKEAQVIEEVGEFRSTGGRKAKAIASVKNIRYAIGIDITRNHVGIVYTDLSEQCLKHERIRKEFQYTNQYFQELTELIQTFISDNEIPKDKIAGIGVSIPGIVDGKRQYITKSHVLDIQNVSCEELTRYIPYPCEFINDANAAAIIENFSGDTEESMVYLSLSNSVGGAVVLKNEVGIVNMSNEFQSDTAAMYIGSNWRSGEFGHMVIHPNGRRCYCGKAGCLDSYCSALRLSELEDGKLEQFFEKLEEGNEAYQKIWQEYLKDLAIAVDNLRMCFDCEIIIGGYVGSYIDPYITELRKIIAQKNIYDYSGMYLKACKFQVEASALGAATYQIEKFINAI